MCTRGNDLAPVPRFNLVSRPPDMTKIYDVIKNTPVELHYWPYKNWGSWHHDDSRVQLLAERLRVLGFHVGLVAHDEEKWDHEGLVKLTSDVHSLVLGQFQHNRYYRKLPSESMEAADEFATEWAVKREGAQAAEGA